MKQHYVYRLIDPITQEFYLGVRSCNGLHKNDNYAGGYISWQPEDPNRLEKEVLAIFPTRKHANRMEKFLIENFIDDELNMNYHVPGVGFNNFGKSLSKEQIELLRKVNSKRILQYTQDGVFLKEWKSMSEAADFYNINVTNISNCCRGIQELGNKFIWKFKKSDNYPKKIKGIIYRNSKAVLQYDLDGNFIKEWRSITQASKQTEINRAGIGGCCRGIYNSSGDYIWKYKNGEIKYNIKPPNKIRKKKVLQYNLNGCLIREFKSIADAGRNLKTTPENIGRAIKNNATAVGFKWKYKNNIG